jgi:hypothetical protein
MSLESIGHEFKFQYYQKIKEQIFLFGLEVWLRARMPA